MTVIYLAIGSIVIGTVLIGLIHLADRKNGYKINLFTEEKHSDKK